MEITVNITDLKKDKALFERVVCALTANYEERITTRMDSIMNQHLRENLSRSVADFVGKKAEEILDTPFVPVTSYGEKSQQTTLRNQIIKQLSQDFLYKFGQWDGDGNTFTKAVNKILNDHLVKNLNKEFIQICIKSAVAALNEKLSKA